jgi:serine/threonine protein kinase
MNASMKVRQDETHLQSLVRDTIRRWRGGERPDADALLQRHPALAENKSLAIDLIYEEFCLRSELGDTLVPSTFCERFPHFEQSLSKMLAVHETLEESSRTLSPPARSPWPKVGDLFLGYELVEALGRGSLARVFLAREAAVGKRLVVVKISRHGAGEAHLLGKAAHPAIVPILSVTHDKETGWTVICMPLMGTATASDLLKTAFGGGRVPRSAKVVAQVATQYCPAGVVPERSAVQGAAAWGGPYADGVARFGLLLAEGLQAAHDVGIMHRDIKPSNVLLAWSGRPMLLDFNLSTEIGILGQREGGTLAYMAPEWMESLGSNGKSPCRAFDPRADIFSLGVLLYELLTGRLPAKPPGAEELPPNEVGPWLAARRAAPPPPRQFDAQIDPCLESIVLRCLVHEPGGRFSTASELASALGRYLGWWPSGWRQMRRRRREVLLASLGAASLAIAGGIYWTSLPPREESLFARGLAEYERGEYQAAAQTLTKCLAIRSAWPEAQFARGQALRMAGNDFGAARSDFLAIKDTNIALAHALAGYCDLRMKNHVAAENDYSLAVQAGAKDAVTWNNLGLCQQRHRQPQTAIRSYSRAIDADPQLAVAYCNRAIARLQESLQSGEPVGEQGLADIRKACELDPQRADFHFHAGAILAREAMPLPGESQPDESFSDKSDQDESLRDDALLDESLYHLQRAYDLGYPPQSLRGFAPGLLDRLKLPPGALDSPPIPYEPPPLYAAPAVTAELAEISGG